MKSGQMSRGRRQGNVFALRLPPEQRAELEALCARDNGPRHLGPWLVWKALQGPAEPAAAPPEPRAPEPRQGNTGARAAAFWRARVDVWEDDGGAIGSTPAPTLERVLPAQPAGVGTTGPGRVIPALEASGGRAAAALRELERLGSPEPPIAERLILDLCAGSGSWSEPYKRAGYRVRRVTLPADDVRTFIVEDDVWGILAAPPCTEFSLAKNGQPRDFAEGLSCVNACMRLVLTARPRWWALENPVGLLGRWLGRPRDVFEPFEFGDPWSKRTALWGEFNPPKRGMRVQPIDGGGPLCSECYPDDPRVCSLSDHRARTPAGFARAFFEANP